MDQEFLEDCVYGFERVRAAITAKSTKGAGD